MRRRRSLKVGNDPRQVFKKHRRDIRVARGELSSWLSYLEREGDDVAAQGIRDALRGLTDAENGLERAVRYLGVTDWG